MLLTSHYGPRQGIFQPMESFKSANWRSSITGIVAVTDGKNYYRAADTRILVPPNSFPARSLTRKQSYRHVASSSLVQVPKTSLRSLKSSKPSSSCPPSPSIPDPSLTPPTPPPKPSPSCSPRPSRPNSSSSPKPNSSSTQKPNPSSLPPPSPKSNPSFSPKPTHPPPAASEAKLKRTYTPHKPYGLKQGAGDQLQSCTIISKPIEMHERMPSKSQFQIYNSPSFPYPNPTRVQGTFASRLAFTSRLSELTRLQTETVKQECIGVYGPLPSRRPISASPASNTSLPQQGKSQQQSSSSVSNKPCRSAKRRSSARPKSAGGSTSTSKLDLGNRKRGQRGSGGRASRRRGSSSQSALLPLKTAANYDGLERRVQSMCILEDTAASAVTSRECQAQEKKAGAREEEVGAREEEGGAREEEGGAQKEEGGTREKEGGAQRRKTKRKGKQLPTSSSSSSLTSSAKHLKKQHRLKSAAKV